MKVLKQFVKERRKEVNLTQEEFALTIAGKKKKISVEILTNFGLDLGLNIKQVNSAYKRFKKQKGNVLSLINNSFLSNEMKQEYIKLLEIRLDLIT